MSSLDNKFTEEDEKKFIEYLNLVAKHSRFDMNTAELISYFKCLSHMQQVVLPKLKDNIFEVKSIKEEPKKKPKSRKK